MNFTSFQQSISSSAPPSEASLYLQALWHDAKGDWDKAHVLIQDLPDQNAAWIHAYLHRKEGDNWNADYWYRRAGKKRPQQTLEEEWQSIASALLEEE
ncbi:hypothetical protein POKO110462_05605 [Pontibacter korlensis]|uniref:Tetratricopeptide repeat protein n=1 Tax=Pontibacter korlensis TaxID=400092 RepID=A0A0E3ZFC0_9BACT|nr:hypothetical protein [Pontibacter korlensis]AKD03424.1 hypothetical protein PKOR_10175 [Pontibacter korlensis]